MKKSLLVFLTLFLLISGCNDNKSAIKEISCEDTLTNIINQETFLLTITASDCDNCKEFNEVQKETLEKNKLIVYTLDYDSLKLEDINSLRLYLKHIDSLPMTFYIVEGKVFSTFRYQKDKGEWNKWLKKIKVIKK